MPNEMVFTVGNLGGVIYYVTFPNAKFKFQQAKQMVEQVATQVVTYSALILEGGGALADNLADQISFNLNFGLTQKQVNSLAYSTGVAAIAGISAALGAATLNSVYAKI